MTSDPQQSEGGSPPTVSRPPDDEISLWEVLAVLVRRRRLIVSTTVLAVGAALAVAFLVADRYTTQASFRPQGSEASASQLMALAGQFGINVPGGGEEASPAFYAELLTSREILRRAADREYAIEGLGMVHLVDLLEIEEDTEALAVEEAIEELRDHHVRIELGRESGMGVIVFSVRFSVFSCSIATINKCQMEGCHWSACPPVRTGC